MMELSAKDLTVGYGKQAICAGISFTVRSGEILTMIGPNGAGKSTLLRTMAGQLPPLRGEVLLDGRPLHSLRPREAAQKTALLLTDRIRPELMTCREVVEAGRYPYTGRLGILSRRDHEAVSSAMALAGVTELGTCPFDEISDGQRQRVLLARAVAQEPEVLLLDEPTSFLDIRHKLEFLRLLRNLAEERGVAVLLSLHELELAARVSDRLLCIRDGRIDRMGTPEEIFAEEYPAELFSVRAEDRTLLRALHITAEK